MKQEPFIHRRERVWINTLADDGKLQSKLDAELLAHLRGAGSAKEVNAALREEMDRTRSW